MYKTLVPIFLALLLVAGSGCSRLPEAWDNFFTRDDTAIDFDIGNVQVVGQTGTIRLEGVASLPDDTQLAVSAIRNLADDSSLDGFSEHSRYAILDRQFATVSSGQWQAEMVLWQPDANNSLFESWQFNAALAQETLAPSPTVVLIVALEPASFSDDIEGILANATINDGNSQLSYTVDGEPYLQVRQPIAVTVPAGPVALEAGDSTLAAYTELWQERSDYNPKVDELTNSPQRPFAEEDNLPLPIANMMQ